MKSKNANTKLNQVLKNKLKKNSDIINYKKNSDLNTQIFTEPSVELFTDISQKIATFNLFFYDNMLSFTKYFDNEITDNLLKKIKDAKDLRKKRITDLIKSFKNNIKNDEYSKILLKQLEEEEKSNDNEVNIIINNYNNALLLDNQKKKKEKEDKDKEKEKEKKDKEKELKDKEDKNKEKEKELKDKEIKDAKEEAKKIAKKNKDQLNAEIKLEDMKTHTKYDLIPLIEKELENNTIELNKLNIKLNEFINFSDNYNINKDLKKDLKNFNLRESYLISKQKILYINILFYKKMKYISNKMIEISDKKTKITQDDLLKIIKKEKELRVNKINNILKSFKNDKIQKFKKNSDNIINNIIDKYNTELQKFVQNFWDYWFSEKIEKRPETIKKEQDDKISAEKEITKKEQEDKEQEKKDKKNNDDKENIRNNIKKKRKKTKINRVLNYIKIMNDEIIKVDKFEAAFKNANVKAKDANVKAKIALNTSERAHEIDIGAPNFNQLYLDNTLKKAEEAVATKNLLISKAEFEKAKFEKANKQKNVIQANFDFERAKLKVKEAHEWVKDVDNELININKQGEDLVIIYNEELNNYKDAIYNFGEVLKNFRMTSTIDPTYLLNKKSCDIATINKEKAFEKYNKAKVLLEEKKDELKWTEEEFKVAQKTEQQAQTALNIAQTALNIAQTALNTAQNNQTALNTSQNNQTALNIAQNNQTF
jgi:hypothetical protein